MSRLNPGRPRIDGERTASGRLKAKSAAPPSDGLKVSVVQAEALRRFSREMERAANTTNAETRLDARESLAAAKARLDPRQFAILDLVVLRGRSIRQLATQSGQTVEQLDQLLRQAANSLEDHYRQSDAA